MSLRICICVHFCLVPMIVCVSLLPMHVCRCRCRCRCISACMYVWYVDVYMHIPSLYKLVEMLIHTCIIYSDVCIIIHECACMLHCFINVSLMKENAFIPSLLDCIYNICLPLCVWIIFFFKTVLLCAIYLVLNGGKCQNKIDACIRDSFLIFFTLH